MVEVEIGHEDLISDSVEVRYGLDLSQVLMATWSDPNLIAGRTD